MTHIEIKRYNSMLKLTIGKQIALSWLHDRRVVDEQPATQIDLITREICEVFHLNSVDVEYLQTMMDIRRRALDKARLE